MKELNKFLPLITFFIGFMGAIWLFKQNRTASELALIENAKIMKLNDSLNNERKILIQKVYLLQSIETEIKSKIDTMRPETKLTLINNELLDLRNYIETLKADKTITIYTAQSMLAKIDRCNRIQDGMILSKNR